MAAAVRRLGMVLAVVLATMVAPAVAVGQAPASASGTTTSRPGAQKPADLLKTAKEARDRALQQKQIAGAKASETHSYLDEIDHAGDAAAAGDIVRKARTSANSAAQAEFSANAEALTASAATTGVQTAEAR
jgi:hypothetical protein